MSVCFWGRYVPAGQSEAVNDRNDASDFSGMEGWQRVWSFTGSLLWYPLGYPKRDRNVSNLANGLHGTLGFRADGAGFV